MGEEVVLGAPPPARLISATGSGIRRRRARTSGEMTSSRLIPGASRSRRPPARPPWRAGAACRPSSPAGSRARQARAATSPDAGGGAARPPATARAALQLSRRTQAARRLELALGGAGGADEVRVVGVRESVRLGSHLGDDAPLLEREHGVDDAGGEQVALDLLPALRVRAGVCRALLAPSAARRRPRRRCAGRRRPRRSASAPRGAGSAGPSATRRRGTRREGRRRGSTDARRRAGRPLEQAGGRRPRTPACASVSSVSVRPLDVQLVARRAVERAATVGADLGRDAEVGEQRNARRASAEDARSRWNETAPRPRRCTAPGRVEERRDLGEPVAPSRAARSPRAPRGRPRPAIPSSELHPLEREQPALELRAGAAVAADPVRGDDAVARDHERVAVLGAERPRRARGARPARERRQLAVGDDLTPRDRPRSGQRARAAAASPSRRRARRPRTTSARPRGVRESSAQIRHKAGTVP